MIDMSGAPPFAKMPLQLAIVSLHWWMLLGSLYPSLSHHRGHHLSLDISLLAVMGICVLLLVKKFL